MDYIEYIVVTICTIIDIILIVKGFKNKKRGADEWNL